MRRIRDFLTFVALLGLTGISVAGAIVAARQSWSHPTASSRIDAWSVLIQEDLTAADPVRQRAVLGGLEADLSESSDWRTRAAQLTADQRQRLVANLNALAPLWLADEAEHYFERPPESRDAYLDRRISHLQQLVAAAKDIQAEGVAASPASLLTDAPLMLNRWLEAIEPARREQTQEFVRLAVMRFLARPQPKR